MSFKVEGLDRIENAARRVRDEVAKELTKALYASAKKVEAEAKKSVLSGGKTGRVYTRRTVTHRASAPGEAPASDTGRLVNSINGTLAGTTAEVTASARYSRPLEFGTAKMAARPFLFPALEKSRAWIQERLNRAVRTAAINASKR